MRKNIVLLAENYLETLEKCLEWELNGQGGRQKVNIFIECHNLCLHELVNREQKQTIFFLFRSCFLPD